MILNNCSASCFDRGSCLFYIKQRTGSEAIAVGNELEAVLLALKRNFLEAKQFFLQILKLMAIMFMAIMEVKEILIFLLL